MITPRFSCRQDELRIIVSVYCPAVRAADLDIAVSDSTVVTIHINPYFLRLNFSNPVLPAEDEATTADYDPTTGYFSIYLKKQIPGTTFQDLDLLSKLLAPRIKQLQNTSIEVISSSSTESSVENIVKGAEDLSLDPSQNDWTVNQEAPSQLRLSLQSQYGFLDLHSNYFLHVSSTENEVNELGDVTEQCTPEERRRLRIAHENSKWDEEYYLADFVDDEHIQQLLDWEHPYYTNADILQYTERENLAMLGLPRKEYLSSSGQTHNLYLTLITFLFSYAYESRTTLHDPTPESAWTICSLTPALSSLDPAPYEATPLNPPEGSNFSASEIAATLAPSFRRSLAFPLYRSFLLAKRCQSDVAGMLSKGKRAVFRCLLDMKEILDHHDVYYIYSKIWLDDFCVWIQSYASDDILLQLSEILRTTEVDKARLGWDIEELEAMAKEAQDLARDRDSDDESSNDSEEAEEM